MQHSKIKTALSLCNSNGGCFKDYYLYLFVVYISKQLFINNTATIHRQVFVMTKTKLHHVTYSNVITKTTQTSFKCYVLLTLLVIVSLITFIAGVVLLFKSNASCDNKKTAATTNTVTRSNAIKDLGEYCELSEEAKRINYENIITKVSKLYYKYFPHKQLSAISNRREKNKIAKMYEPFNPTPQHLKTLADDVNRVSKELASLSYQEDQLKPNEAKTLEEVKMFLLQFFGSIYSTDFYSGDWMLGPNFSCTHRVCELADEISTLLHEFRPRSGNDLLFIVKTFLSYGKIFKQYISNLKLGIEAGMVQSRSACIAGSEAFKMTYLSLISHGKHKGAQKDKRFAIILTSEFYQGLTKKVKDKWLEKYGRNHFQTLYDSLVEGFTTPLIEYYDFLSIEHLKHCPPDDVASGLSNLPLKHLYFNGVKNGTTTGQLPITGELLDGKEIYRRLLHRVTTTDITPEEVYVKGLQQTLEMYENLVYLSKKISGESDTNLAIEKVQTIVNAADQWYGPMKFPENESNEEAHARCVDDESANKYCPQRMKSIKEWRKNIYQILSIIQPRLNDIFYFSGEKNSVPNCPINVGNHYNPSFAASYFVPSDENCSYPTNYALPFFLDRFGPRFSGWSTTGHEARPGHHIQKQGTLELFKNPCNDELHSFLNSRRELTGYVEGWALYAENPILSDEVILYEEDLLQKLGMFKMQIWNSVRLIVDSGIHYRNKNRSWAIEQFKKYTWDNSDLVEKEVTRYMSLPGQATAYSVGRLAFIKASEQAIMELDLLFDVKEFHYQVLSIGEVTLTYLQKYIDRYINCNKFPDEKFCEYTRTPVRGIPKAKKQTIKPVA